jgi:predicted metal-dependent peptidase
MSKKALTLLQKARTQLLLNHPFFAQIVLETRYNFTDSVPTMATDGHIIAINPKFTESLSVKEIMGVLAHECMHILGMHHLRMYERDPKKWNHATDYAINLLLTDDGFELPQGGLLDTKWKNMSSEEIYNKLPKPNENDDPSFGEVRPNGSLSGNEPQPGESQAEAEAREEQRVKEMAAKAATAAKMQGKLPGHIERMVNDLIATKTPWHELLRKYMTRPAKNDYSWSTPNRRYASRGMYLPAMSSNDSMGEVVLAIDTSGSISNRELSTFQAQIKAIVEDARPSAITIMYFDTNISSVTEITEPSSTDIKLVPTGGGGTDFRPIFDWLTKHDKHPEVVVVLTDMYAQAPEFEEFDTIWAALPGSAEHTPFGTRIDIEWEDAA